MAEDVAAVVGRPVEDQVPWRDLRHDGPVPAGLGADRLARVRAAHLASRGWVSESPALALLRVRDRRISAASQRGPSRVLVRDRSRLCLGPCSGCRPVIRSFQVRRGWSRSPIAPTATSGQLGGAAEATHNARRRSRPPLARSPSLNRSARVRGCLPISPMIGPDCRELERAVRDVEARRSVWGRAVPAGFGQERPLWIADQPLLAVANDLAPPVSRSADGQHATTAFRYRRAGWPGCAAQGGSVVFARSVPGGSCCGRFPGSAGDKWLRPSTTKK
jgi:hypothetical protein